jgi:hypothetical protein
MNLAVPVAIGLVALVGVVVIWQIRQKHGLESPQPVAARTANPVVAPAPVQIAKAPVAKPQITQVAAEKQGTNVTGPVVTAPSPPVLKLQAILFSGHGSSAMISGQTVATGDEVDGYRITAIGQRSVTLASAKETKVLTLNR